ncbi:hypothetical protein ACIQPR_14225 [Streptomyces sp. NPDC091280]|uniref:hypothetical protein n=1 Tax=Streptomyces sp. NPDC091280 TaxID=3365984 RepID=UPI00380E722E
MRGARAPFSVGGLDEAGRMPWRARRRLRAVRGRGGTGVVLVAEIREPVRGFTDRAGIVGIHEDGQEICSRTRFAKAPTFVELPPGRHELEFSVLRWRARGTSSFRRVVELREGDVLVARCDPVQPHTFYRRSPSADTWFLGVLRSGEDVSDSFKTRRPPPPTVAP